MRRRRSSCSSTVARSGPGPAGRGAGTPTSSSNAATPSSCRTRPSRWATARRSSTVAGDVGPSPVHRRHHGRRRCRRAARHRRGAHGVDGRLVRRLHGQLGRGPHRPVRGHRHPRLAVGAAWLPRHDRRRASSGSRRWATRTSTRRATRPPPKRRGRHIRTPMLVIHGELDARVPIGEALRLWTDLARHDVPAKVPVLPGREPLGAQAPEPAHLVRDGARLPRPSRDGSGVGPSGAV